MQLDRDDIHTLSRHSNVPAAQVQQWLKHNVYSGTAAWQKFLQLFFIGLGVCFTTAGIVFFFAYNWNDLGKFAKMGLVGGVLLALVAVVLLSRATNLIKNILLTGATVLVGALFAVYGQVYQTGADAYDLFIAWTACVTLWVLVAGFAPLWLVYISLVNTTLVLYLVQTYPGMEGATFSLVVYCLNTVFLVASLALGRVKTDAKAPKWFTNTLALCCAYVATQGVVVGLLDNNANVLPILLLVSLTYAAALWYAWRAHQVFYFAIIPFSVIIILCGLMLDASTDMGMFLLVSVFIIAGVTLTIKLILNLQKKWAHA